MKKTLLTMLAMAAAISASAATTPNLVTNGDADNGLNGWTKSGTSNFSAWFDGMDYNWFRAEGDGSRLSQTIVLADKGITPRDIASGATVTASVIARGGKTGNATVYQLGADEVVLASNTVFAVSNAVASTSYPEIEFALNPGTRKLKYELFAEENDSSYSIKFRGCSLKITTVTPQYQITFVSEGAAVGVVTNWSIAAVTPPTVNRDGYHFFGYYTQASGGERVFDENGAYALSPSSTWTPTDDVTLYAQWMLSVVNFSFVSGGATVGSAEYQASSTVPEAPIAPRHGDDRFIGYFTAPTDGVKVFDENYDFVRASASSLTSDTTLYAQWAPVVSTPQGGITRLVYRGVLTNFGEWSSSLRKTMHVKVYDSASAATPLWSGDAADVPINPDGSFEAVFGNDDLALAFASNNLTHVELTVGDSLSPLAPRRAFASVASVNRALVAEGAASDIKVGTLGANAIVAEKITAGTLEASETVRVEGSVSVEVKPFDIKQGQETTIWRGEGVSVWGDSEFIKTVSDVVAGQWLWTADREGVVMIHATGKTRSALRIPATIQFVRPGDEVRAPTWENGEVSVTVWGYKK